MRKMRESVLNKGMQEGAKVIWMTVFEELVLKIMVVDISLPHYYSTIVCLA
mgnify:FL=1